MFLPALTVALAISPILIRSLRASMLDVLAGRLHHHRPRQGHLRAPGDAAPRPAQRASISTVTVLGVNIAYLVGGTLVVEQVFALPGIGTAA